MQPSNDLEKRLESREERNKILREIDDYAYFGAVGELIKNLEKNDKDSAMKVAFLADKANRLRTITILAIKKIDRLDQE